MSADRVTRGAASYSRTSRSAINRISTRIGAMAKRSSPHSRLQYSRYSAAKNRHNASARFEDSLRVHSQSGSRHTNSTPSGLGDFDSNAPVPSNCDVHGSFSQTISL